MITPKKPDWQMESPTFVLLLNDPHRSVMKLVIMSKKERIKFIFLLVIALPLIRPFTGWGQDLKLPFDPLTHKVSYTGNISLKTISSAKLYKNAKKFVDRPGQVSTRSFDDTSQKVSARASLHHYALKGSTTILYRLYIECHEGFYKYWFTDFLISDWPGYHGSANLGADFDKDDPGPISKSAWLKTKSFLDSGIKKLIGDLRKAMSLPG
jgi:hypothetical protein